MYTGTIHSSKFSRVTDRDIATSFGKNKVIYMLINMSVCAVNVDCSIHASQR
ncbi:hypothetical protein LTSEMIS_2640 [Salmonella enterica subsp. enterica serovar Mississippi str. A4-633]|nr:hypothetical protein LTSEMIS_2640 [Salmonella enterica subsp. enterica serovar Mississippi str. A4-633]